MENITSKVKGFMKKINGSLEKFKNNITHPILINNIVVNLKEDEIKLSDFKEEMVKDLDKYNLKDKQRQKAIKKINQIVKKVEEKLKKDGLEYLI